MREDGELLVYFDTFMKEMLIDNKEKTSPVWFDVQVECPLESKVMGYFTLQEEKGKKKAHDGVLRKQGGKEKQHKTNRVIDESHVLQ